MVIVCRVKRFPPLVYMTDLHRMSRLELFRCTHGAMLGQMDLIKNDGEAIEATLNQPAIVTLDDH